MQERFSFFSFKISFLDKCIKSLEADAATRFGVKGVHMFWIYSLYQQPNGMTASEIAKKNNVNRSLVSREIQKLAKADIVYFADEGTESRYNRRILLTERGRAVAREIRRIGLRVQQLTSAGLSEEEIAVFYAVLDKMSENLGNVVHSKKSII